MNEIKSIDPKKMKDLASNIIKFDMLFRWETKALDEMQSALEERETQLRDAYRLFREALGESFPHLTPNEIFNLASKIWREEENAK